MADIRFYGTEAMLRFGDASFRLPLTEATLDNMQEKATELLKFVTESDRDRAHVTAELLRAIDGILGEGACERIFDGIENVGMMDALDVFVTICETFTGAWRKRLLEFMERNGK